MGNNRNLSSTSTTEAVAALQKENKDLKEQLEKLSQGLNCYSLNASEFIQEFNAKFVSDDGKIIKLTFTSGTEIANSIWEKVKETLKECEGREIVVVVPTGIKGLIVNSALSVIKAITGVTIKL